MQTTAEVKEAVAIATEFHAFLMGVIPESVQNIGLHVFFRLFYGPAILNIAQLARQTGYSRYTAQNTVCFLLKSGRITRIEEDLTGKRRPCKYRLIREMK